VSERVSRWPSVMRIVVPLCLLGLVFWSLDFHALLETFAGMAARDLLLGTALGLLLVQLQIVLSAWRWHTTATSLGQALSLSDAVREYYLSTLVNQSLPGGVVGDAARVVRSRQQSGIAVAAQSVLIERMAGQVVLALLVVVGLIAWPFVVDAARGRFAASLWPALQRAWFANGAWQVQLLLSLAIVSSYLALFAVAALTLGAPLPWNNEGIAHDAQPQNPDAALTAAPQQQANDERKQCIDLHVKACTKGAALMARTCDITIDAIEHQCKDGDQCQCPEHVALQL